MKSLLAVGLAVTLLSAPLASQAQDSAPRPSRVERAADWLGNHLGFTGSAMMVAGAAAMTWGGGVYIEALVAAVAGVAVTLPLDLAFVAVALGLVAAVMGYEALMAWADEPASIGSNIPRNAATSLASAAGSPSLPGTAGIGVTR